MANLTNINFMNENKFNLITETNDDELYLVKSGKICEVVFTGLAVNNVYSKTLPVYLPFDLSKVFCNVYAKVVTDTTYYKEDDIIPFSSFWGNNYRNLTAWFNRTRCGFNTSNQMTANNKTQSDTGTNIVANIEIHFDFYLIG